MSDSALWLALAAALIGCYFAAVAIALRTFNRGKLAELLEDAGKADRMHIFMQRLNAFTLVAGMLRSTLSLAVILAALHFFSHHTTLSLLWQYLAAFAVSGVLVSIFMVAIPVSWARYHPEHLLSISMPTLNFCLALFLPIAKAMHFFDPIVRRISGADIITNDQDAATEEVMSVVEDHETTGKVDRAQREIIEAVFDLPNTTADQIMTPRTDIEGLEVNATIDEITQHVMEEGHSRIPIYEDNLDHIVGLLYVKDLIPYLPGSNGKALADFTLRSVLREAMMVPETKSVQELLAEFRARQVHIAIVLDEYGGTAGLVTIEDILEELVGDIQDEYELDEESPDVKAVDINTADVDARVHVDDLNDQLDIDLPESEDYDTVGGFVVSQLGHIPEPGEIVETDGVRLTVTAAEKTKVTTVRVEKLDEESTTEDSDAA